MAPQVAAAPETILRMFAVPHWPRWYVLTPYESPNNVMAQQVRAINLIHALISTGTVNEGERIGIVGAGAAGVTAAAYAVAKGVAVTILEKGTQPLSRFARSQRYLHPRLFDWPDPGWNHPHAELPVMSWKEGAASRVAKSLRKQWSGWKNIYAFRPIAGGSRFLEFVPNAMPSVIRPAILEDWPPSTELRWRTGNGSPAMSEAEDVAAVIVCVGIGAEKKPSDAEFAARWHSYWSTSEIELKRLAGRLFVWGNGDGAIADMAHAVFQDFSYAKLSTLLQRSLFRGIAADAATIEAQAPFISDDRRSKWLSDRYRALDLSGLRRALPLKPDIRRILIASRSPAELSDGAYAINRLLLSLVVRDRRASYVTEHLAWIRDERVYVASPQLKATVHLNHVVRRHGVLGSLRHELPEIDEAVAGLLKTWGELRLTRRPLWSSPPALAMGQISESSASETSTTDRPQISSCYSDLIDPWLQYEFRRVLMDDADFEAFYVGRLRLLSLLHKNILINAAQVIDGCFFHLLLRDGESRLVELAEECNCRFIKRRLASFLKFQSGRSPAAGWRADWIREPWRRGQGLAKPYHFFSLGPRFGASLYAALSRQNRTGRRVTDAVANAKRHLRILHASKRQFDVLHSIEKAAAWLSRQGEQSSDANADFRITDFYDPGWLYSTLHSSGQEYLRDNAPGFLTGRRPRQAAIGTLVNSPVTHADRARLEDWLYYAYHTEISRVEKTGAWETVYTLAGEWNRWGVVGDGTSSGVSVISLGYLPRKHWKQLAVDCRVDVLKWYACETPNLDAVWKRLASECRPRRIRLSGEHSPTNRGRERWHRRMIGWSRGAYSVQLRSLPARSKTDAKSPVFVMIERDRHRELAVTQFRRDSL